VPRQGPASQRATHRTSVRPIPETLPVALRRPLRAVRRRIRIQRALDGASLLALAGLGLFAVVLVLHRTGWIGAPRVLLFGLGAALLPVLGALVNGLRPLPRLTPAQLLDRAHGLRSRVAAAVELATTPPDQRSPFARAAIADAVRRAPQLSPARALPLRRPRAGGAVAGLTLGVGALAVMAPPPPPPPQVAHRGLAPLLLHADDVQAFDSELDRILQEPTATPELARVAQQYNQLLEDLADRRLDRSEALRQIAALERRILEGRVSDTDALDRSLRRMGEKMRRSDEMEAAAEALREGDPKRAEREMRKLADRVRSQQMSRQELQRLRQDLEKASQRQQEVERKRQEVEKRRDEMERLLQKQREEQKQDTPEQQRLLKNRERELERLRREHEQMREQQRQLERLQRELEKAAEDLNDGQSGDAADSLDRGAEDLNRMARERMSEEQMRQLAEQMRQLRELIRRQRQQQQEQGQEQAGQGQGQGRERMQRFVLRAQGGDGKTPMLMPGQEGQGGQQGQGGSGGDGDGNDGHGKGEGDGQGDGQKALMLGGEGDGQGQRAILEVPGMGQKRSGAGGSGDGRGGAGPCTGSDKGPRGAGDDGRLDGQHDDSRVAGEHAGDGPTRSEVILGAADRGFVTRGYDKVYSDYRQHAEEVLEQDEVPPGYRFYVRRYFQLIRPREEP
jgi:hypothetical protein